MAYLLQNLSYDFGQQRASASFQTPTSPPQNFAYVTVNFFAVPPANISAADLNDFLVAAARRELEQASQFSTKKVGAQE